MDKGTVEWFSSRKDCGFITNGKNGMDIFAHSFGVTSSGFKSLEGDWTTTFDITDSPRDFQTINVCAA